MIAHIVLFSPKPDLEESTKRSFAQSVIDCCKSIPHVRRASIGRRTVVNAGYDRNLGHDAYEFAAYLEFDSSGELTSYLNHPMHQELGRLFWECCAKTTIAEVELVDLNIESIVDELVQ